MASPAYPYVPRSNARLVAGEFWAIPLARGRYACGVVVGVARTGGPSLFAPSNRAFVAGLLDWDGATAPTGAAVAGAGLVAQAVAHVKAITETGGAILGRVATPIEPLSWRTTRRPDAEPWVYAGIEPVRPAGPDDLGLPIVAAVGYGYLRHLAEGRRRD